MQQPADKSNNSTFGLTVVAIVLVCGGLAAVGLRHRREQELVAAPSLLGEPVKPAPPVVEPVVVTEVAETPTEPKAIIRGKVALDDEFLIVTDEEENELLIRRADFGQRVLRLHQDDAANAYWLDLTDGTRVEIDKDAARSLQKALPFGATYTRDDS